MPPRASRTDKLKGIVGIASGHDRPGQAGTSSLAAPRRTLAQLFDQDGMQDDLASDGQHNVADPDALAIVPYRGVVRPEMRSEPDASPQSEIGPATPSRTSSPGPGSAASAASALSDRSTPAQPVEESNSSTAFGLQRLSEGFGWSRITLESTFFGQTQRTRHKLARSVQPAPPRVPQAPGFAVPERALRGEEGDSGRNDPLQPIDTRARTAVYRDRVQLVLFNDLAVHHRPAAPGEPAGGREALPSFSLARLATVGATLRRRAADEVAEAMVEMFAADATHDTIAPQATMLLEALAHVAGPADPVRALNALNALRALDPLAAIDAAARTEPGEAAAADVAEVDAWRIVGDLAGVPSGMALLRQLLRQPIPAQHERDFTLLFKAAAALPGAADQAPTPQRLRLQAAPAQTVAQQAVVCATARLAAIASPDTEQHAWALNAVRNDLYDTAAGSAFAHINARLMKLGVWIDRASGDKPFMPRQPFLSKSPLRSLRRYGLEQVERADDTAQRAALAAAVRDATGALRDALAAAIDAQRVAPTLTEDGMTELLVRQAVLEHCLARPAGTVLEGYALDEDAVPDIANRLATTLLTGMPQDQANEMRPIIEQRLQEQPELRAWADSPQTFSTELLEAWARLPVAADALQPFRAAMQQARAAAEGRDTRPARIDVESVRRALHEVVQNIQGSSRLRWTSGGVGGVGTKGLTSMVSSVLSAFTVRARVDARGSRATQAVFEIAMPPYDMEIVLGTQRQTNWQVGGGVAAGVDLGAAKVLGGVDVVAHGSEHAGIRGISLRLPRERGREDQLRQDFARLVDDILDLTRPGRAALGDEPLLARLLREFPDLTVNRIGDAGEERQRRAVTVEASARGDMQFVRIGGNVSAGVERSEQRRYYEDKTGSLRVHRVVAGRALRANVGAGVAAGVGGTVAEGFHGRASKASLSHPVVSAGVQLDLMARGSARRDEYVYSNGGITSASFVEVEHVTLESFRRSVESQMVRWIAAKVARDLAALRPPAGTPPEDEPDWREAQRDEVAVRVEDGFAIFLNGLKHQDSASQTYAERLQLSAQAAERINQLHSAALLAGRSTQRAAGARGERLQQQADALRDDPASWVPASLRSYERRADQDQPGVHIVVQVSAIHAAESSRIRSRID